MVELFKAEPVEEDFKLPARQRAGDYLEFNQYLIDPTVVENSRYHNLLAKELCIGNIKREDLLLIEMDYKIINFFIFLEVPEMARVYHAELLARLNALRAVDGFERKQQNTTRNVVESRGDLAKTGLAGIFSKKSDETS